MSSSQRLPGKPEPSQQEAEWCGRQQQLPPSALLVNGERACEPGTIESTK